MKKKVWLLLPATLSLLMSSALPKGEEYLSTDNPLSQKGDIAKDDMEAQEPEIK